MRGERTAPESHPGPVSSSRRDKDPCRQATGRWWEALPGPEERNQCETLAVPPRSFDSVLPGCS